MYLKSIALKEFRSCQDSSIEFHEDLTILAGENNSGKSNILDGIRLVTRPISRRDRYAEEADIRRGAAQKTFSIIAQYAGLTDTQKGLLIAAVPDPTKPECTYGFRYTAPANQEGGLRGRVAYWAGKNEGSDPEPEAREVIRHAYLPALRDAQRELASGSGTRIAFLLRHLIGNEDQIKDFVSQAKSAFGNLESHKVIDEVRGRIGAQLTSLTEGVRPQEASIGFAEAELRHLARDLRFRMGKRGMPPADLAESGLGYANLLFMATVLVELEAASEVDLTLFLVEEPEAHLHPQLQAIALDYLKERAEESRKRVAPPGHPEGRIQVIVSTHSPHFTSAVSSKYLTVVRTAAIAEGAPKEGLEETPANGESTVAVPIRLLGLQESLLGKIDRYLNVTRSAILFSPRVMLVEGIAEALLIPVIAKRIVLAQAKDQKALARFGGATLVPIDGVDFAPYLQLLLTQYQGNCIADQVVVVTDADPEIPGDRKKALEEIAGNLGVPDKLKVRVSQITLEAELFDAGNQDLLKKCFLDIHPNSKAKVDALKKGEEFVKVLKGTSTRKGDLAQCLAARIASGEVFAVPNYLAEAIRDLAGE